MSDDTNTGVEDVADPVSEVDESLGVEEVSDKKSDKDQNITALRQSAAQLKAEKDQYKLAYEMMLTAMQSKNSPSTPVQAQETIDDIINSIPEDDYVDTKTFKKALMTAYKQAKNDAKKEAVQEYNVSTLEERTAGRLNDFYDVMSDENIDKFIKTNKYLHDAVKKSENPYEAAYHMIKNHKDFNPGSGHQKKDVEKRLKEVAAKPKVGSATANGGRSEVISSVSSFRSMTKEQKAALINQTNIYARGGR